MGVVVARYLMGCCMLISPVRLEQNNLLGYILVKVACVRHPRSSLHSQNITQHIVSIRGINQLFRWGTHLNMSLR